ncbi:hypothetical protein SCANM63S_07984 [Streptomyces canarius]
MNQSTEVFQPLQADDPPVVAGYRLAARLGAGGMGRVYLSHTQGGRPVALKVVRPELADDPDFRRRFGREIKAARRVKGAYTAELIDADADGVPPWLATLFVQRSIRGGAKQAESSWSLLQRVRSMGSAHTALATMIRDLVS